MKILSLIKLLTYDDTQIPNKLIQNKFSIVSTNNMIIIDCIDIKSDRIKVPIYNIYNGIDYYPIVFPLHLPIISEENINYLFNPYIILSSNNLNIENSIDFFYNLFEHMKTKFQFKILYFDDLINNKNINLINILDIFEKNMWLHINIIKLFVIYILIKYPNISNKNYHNITFLNKNKILTPLDKKLFTYANLMKSIKYNLFSNQIEHCMNFIDYYKYDYKTPLKLQELKPNTHYFITEINNNHVKTVNIYITKITNNIITTNTTNIVYDKYKWYSHYYVNNSEITKECIIYKTFMNNVFTNEIIKKIYGLNANNILNYFMNESYSNFIKNDDDFEILKNNSFSPEFFINITEKYFNDSKNVFQILEILFKNYIYPLKPNKHDLEPLFDYIMYFSLYNSKVILLESNECILYSEVNNIIPYKLKNLYINLLKLHNQISNNNYSTILFNKKFYTDVLHKNIIKIIFSNNKRLFTKLFKNSLSPSIFDKFKKIIMTNIILIDIGTKLTWNNISNKLNYLKYYYDNYDILYYQDKFNRNIIPESFDIKIKKIIEHPFNMYPYLKKEKDFIRWTNFISDRMIDLYYNPITLLSSDFNIIGTILFLLFNFKEQLFTDDIYHKLIKICNLNKKIILNSNNRINLKIKEYFPNIKINLGLYAKHLTNKDNTLEEKLNKVRQKYYKYKMKYLESISFSMEASEK